jgi:outer membrane protein assembly factor BamC
VKPMLPSLASSLPLSLASAPAPTRTGPAAPPAGRSQVRATASRLAVLSLVATLSGCSALGGLFGGDTDSKKSSPSRPLEVPPDLTQLAKDSRYQVQGGVVSASTAAAPLGASTVPAAPPLSVAISQAGGMRIERAGQQRWLVVPAAPEQLWPALKSFWEQKGYSIELEDAKAGVMETNWSMNRAKLPADAARNVLGRVLGNLYDTGERDRFRTRLERTAGPGGGTEIYISHRSAEEVFLSERRENTTWRARPSDPQLEAEILSQLMVTLGAKEEAARVAAATTAAAAAPKATNQTQPRANAAATASPMADSRAPGAISTGSTSLELDEPFDRAWRRVGLALDRGGFTVEDRDRASGFYYVRYVDPKAAGKDEPGFWARLFGNTSNPQAAVRYRLALRPAGNKTTVSVQSSSGGTDVGENGQRIATLLVNELK